MSAGSHASFTPVSRDSISFSHGLEMEFIVVFSFTLKIHLSCLHTIIRDERQLGVG